MTAAAVLEMAIVAMQHAQDLQGIFAKAAAEGRADLTPDEIAAVHAMAAAASARLATTIASMH